MTKKGFDFDLCRKMLRRTEGSPAGQPYPVGLPTMCLKGYNNECERNAK